MLLHYKKVAIVGGGPVGLTMAKLLQQGGADVRVYERDVDAQARIWGGTLDLHKGTGQDALEKAGLLQRYYELALPMGIKFASADGIILATKTPTPANMQDNPEINRNVLRTMLMESLQPGTIQWNSKLTSLKFNNQAWQLQFEDYAATADIVIVASGGMSSVRSHVTDEVVEQTGSFIVQGDVVDPAVAVPGFFQLCDKHRLMAAHGGNLLVANPLNNGTLTYGLIFTMPDHWDSHPPVDFNNRDEAVDYLTGRLSTWSPLYQDLIKKTIKFVGLPTRLLPLDRPWKSFRSLPITLIGDAAHLMPPFAGMGVNIGLVDAMMLAENLLGDAFTTINAAIQDYEMKMFKYAKDASQASRENELQMGNPAFDFRQLLQMA